VSQDNVIKLAQPGEFCDALTAVLRQGARSLLTQAVEAEIASFLETHADKLTEDGHRRLVRHGHLPERQIATGIGLVSVRQPRVRDRRLRREERIRFSPSILPPDARRSKSLDVLIQLLHLKGISTGNFAEALGFRTFRTKLRARLIRMR
jgi:transposase-like protein